MGHGPSFVSRSKIAAVSEHEALNSMTLKGSSTGCRFQGSVCSMCPLSMRSYERVLVCMGRQVSDRAGETQ